MPAIACLGWGSLIWRPGTLPIEPWAPDGPNVQVEFLRQSGGGRVTLVLDDATDPVPSLWARMKAADVADAVAALATRENTPEKNIGIWRSGDEPPALIDDLAAWAHAHAIDAVIWTALPRTFADFGEALQYLKNRAGDERVSAEQYVRYAPPQIKTKHRADIEAVLEWTPQIPPSGTEPYAALAYAHGPHDVGAQLAAQENAMTKDGDDADGLMAMPAFIKEVMSQATAQEGADTELLAILGKHIVTMFPLPLPVEGAFADIEKLADKRAKQEPGDGGQDHN